MQTILKFGGVLILQLWIVYLDMTVLVLEFQ